MNASVIRGHANLLSTAKHIYENKPPLYPPLNHNPKIISFLFFFFLFFNNFFEIKGRFKLLHKKEKCFLFKRGLKDYKGKEPLLFGCHHWLCSEKIYNPGYSLTVLSQKFIYFPVARFDRPLLPPYTLTVS